MADIPGDIARKIAVEHVENQEDFENFKQVCSTWWSETKDIKFICPSKNTQLPWLMLVDSPTSPHRRFYSLSSHMYRKMSLPEFDEDADDNRRYLSSRGWLIGVSRNQAIIHFFSLVTTQVIKPPPLPIHSLLLDGDVWCQQAYLYQTSIFCISSSSSGCFEEAAMVFDMYRYIGFWRPGQQEWVKPTAAFKLLQVEDVCFFRGQFYSIDQDFRVIAYDDHTPKPKQKQARIVAKLNNFKDIWYTKAYIAALQTTLLVIFRFVNSLENEKKYWTESFQLFEVNVDDGNVTRRQGIGDRALFVGYNSTFFVEASPSDPRGCRPNSIYFTDDFIDKYSPAHHPRGGGADMGIFCLDQNKVHQVYDGPSRFSYETPPTWFQLPPY